MQKGLAVYLRELQSYFSSQIIYVIGVVFVLIIGNISRNTFFQFSSQSMEMLRTSIQYGSDMVQPLNINAVVVRIFSYINLMLMLITPLLTMRLYAEEKRNGTMELLITSPVTTTQVMLGKFFSCLSIYTILLSCTFVFILIIDGFSRWTVDLGPVMTSYLGAILLGAAAIPVGMFFSSLTQNQIVAAFISLFVLLAFWILVITANLFGYPLNQVVAYISLAGHQETLQLGMFGIKHVVYYLTFSVFWLVLTWMSIESARWRE
jgi:ABC-2 type transport system permease protein